VPANPPGHHEVCWLNPPFLTGDSTGVANSADLSTYLPRLASAFSRRFLLFVRAFGALNATPQANPGLRLTSCADDAQPMKIKKVPDVGTQDQPLNQRSP